MTGDEKIISMIVAATENGVIGRDGDMPWKLSADLKNFKGITSGHTIIMGRKTWDSIQRLLPGRTTVIVTRQADFHVDGAIVVGSMEAAIAATEDPAPFVVGGAEIYRLAMPMVHQIFLTRIHAEIPGDTLLPEIDFRQWEKIESTRHPADEKNSHDYSFQRYQRRDG